VWPHDAGLIYAMASAYRERGGIEDYPAPRVRAAAGL